MFVFYMSAHRKADGTPLIAATIDGYMSHVVFYLIDCNIIDITSDFRCPSTQRLLHALTLQDAARLGPLHGVARHKIHNHNKNKQSHQTINRIICHCRNRRII